MLSIGEAIANLWAFDLLAFTVVNFVSNPPGEPPGRLQAPGEALRLHPSRQRRLARLRVAEERGLEGVVRKRRDVAFWVGRMQELAEGKDGGVARGQPGTWGLFERDQNKAGTLAKAPAVLGQWIRRRR